MPVAIVIATNIAIVLIIKLSTLSQPELKLKHFATQLSIESSLLHQHLPLATFIEAIIIIDSLHQQLHNLDMQLKDLEQHLHLGLMAQCNSLAIVSIEQAITTLQNHMLQVVNTTTVTAMLHNNSFIIASLHLNRWLPFLEDIDFMVRSLVTPTTVTATNKPQHQHHLHRPKVQAEQVQIDCNQYHLPTYLIFK